MSLQHFTYDMFKAGIPKVLQSGIAFYLMLLSEPKMNANKISLYKVFDPCRHIAYSATKTVVKVAIDSRSGIFFFFF